MLGSAGNCKQPDVFLLDAAFLEVVANSGPNQFDRTFRHPKERRLEGHVTMLQHFCRTHLLQVMDTLNFP